MSVSTLWHHVKQTLSVSLVPFCVESTADQWIPLTKGQLWEALMFYPVLLFYPEQAGEEAVELTLFRDATTFIVRKYNIFVCVPLTHWGRVTHICVNKLTIIGSDNGLSPDRRQAIIWTNAGILLIGPLGTNFSEILMEILTFSFKKMRLKVSSAKRRPFCLGLNVLTHFGISNCSMSHKICSLF